ncbi:MULTISPECIES: ABC transporter ATP-binding protein [unclassified Rhodococcus (in: high G+C Gram-positive bacteria)]|uniref:ABC transporter ATP-binding protein n=1 Tax=unclassified Rhodococcus (in: high G+C Gram-positive bacteria) TaxID=192944 RepID=UPI00233EC06E|nr:MULTISPECIES: ABC transporter ATP-binding protein [unclassified Rhodococcus (in: high G+C Gram-positive bacteria)]MDC3724491.1 ABC transporter ATP-binding protein [Rhodococcus sp. Rp3]WSE22643.1 ABC transporter ATP-binding protein [Rhodococcus sp. PD04]
MITFDNVEKRYPDGTVAVDGLSLEVPTGTLTVFVGPSGCGKTTSLRMINRMVEPSGGRMLVGGRDVRDEDPRILRRGIGYVIQHAGLFPHRTVVDNVATVPRLLGASRKEARATAMDVLTRVGLGNELAQRYPSQLSGGQQQRVGVARALAADPPILLMDEPFSAVDPVVRKDLQDELLRLQSVLAKTIVLVTHDIDEAIKLGDRVAVLRPGGVLAQYATPEELLTSPADDFVAGFLGVDRGVRLMSFFSSADLPLRTDPIVTRDAAELAVGDGWLLVVDDDGRPAGWRDGSADAEFLSAGRPFLPGRDPLRVVLDAAVLSPSGHAVAVDDDGRALGVISGEEVAAAVRAAHNNREAGTPSPLEMRKSR